MLFLLLVGLFLSTASAVVYNTTGIQFQMVYPGLNTTYWNENPSLAGSLCDEYLAAMNISTVATCNVTKVFDMAVQIPDGGSGTSRRLVSAQQLYDVGDTLAAVIVVLIGSGYIDAVMSNMEIEEWIGLHDLPYSGSVVFDDRLPDGYEKLIERFFKNLAKLARGLSDFDSVVVPSQVMYSMQPIAQNQSSSSADETPSINLMMIIILLSSLLFLTSGALVYLFVKGRATLLKDNSVEVKEVVLNVM